MKAPIAMLPWVLAALLAWSLVVPATAQVVRYTNANDPMHLRPRDAGYVDQSTDEDAGPPVGSPTNNGASAVFDNSARDGGEQLVGSPTNNGNTGVYR